MQNIDNEDGYATLYQILRTVLPQLQDFRPKWGPTLDKNMDMYRFITKMQRHIATEVKFHRPYSELEMVTNIIQHALDDRRYEMTARTAKASIQQSLAQGTSVAFTMLNIAQTLEPSKNTHRTMEEGDIPTMNKFDAPRRPQPLDPKKQVQCRSCMMWGHDGQCYMMCKVVNILKWIKENPEESEKQAAAYTQSHSKKMVNVLKVDDEEAQTLGIENMMSALYEAEDEQEPTPAMKKMQAPAAWEEMATEYYQSMDGAFLQPFNMVAEYIDSRIVQPPKEPPPEKTATNVIMKTMKINLQQDDIRHIRFTHQADGGANFAATDRLDLLHNYKPYIEPISIVAFFTPEEGDAPQESHTAIGEGILKLIGDHGEIIPMRMLYTPNSTGTVISPERTMKDMQRFNPKSNRIVAWSQNGGLQRSVQWKNKEGRVV